MEFFNSAVEVLQTLVIALGAGLGIWGGINLMEGYGNPESVKLVVKSHAHFALFCSEISLTTAG